MVRTFLIAVALWGASGNAIWGQYEGLLGRIPKDANAAVFIDAEKLFGSPVAQAERWRTRSDAAFEAGLSALPPTASAAVLAANLDLEFAKPVWELALLKIPQGGSLIDVAQRFGGMMDNLEGKSAVKLPNDSYVLQLSDQVIAAYMPSNRQDVSRWIRATDSADSGQTYSPYLRAAYHYAAEVGSPIIMAVDLENAFPKPLIAQRLADSPSVAGAGVDVAAAAELFGTLQGVMLGITFTDRANGAIRVDFGQSPQLLAAAGKPLLLEILERNGWMIDDFRSWQPVVKGNTLLLSGPLSTLGMRRVLSVLQLPPTLAAAHDQVALTESPSAESAQRLASQQYFKSVTSLLDDLRDKPSAKTFGQAAAWYDRYAQKIDMLPMLNVDEALLDYGQLVSDSLRQAEMAAKGVGMRSTVRTSGSLPGSTWDGYYGYGGYRSTFSAARAAERTQGRVDTAVRTQERVGGAASIQQLWQQIESATADIRREMTQKYQSEF